jgi:hypothetical protein
VGTWLQWIEVFAIALIFFCLMLYVQVREKKATAIVSSALFGKRKDADAGTARISVPQLISESLIGWGVAMGSVFERT